MMWGRPRWRVTIVVGALLLATGCGEDEPDRAIAPSAAPGFSAQPVGSATPPNGDFDVSKAIEAVAREGYTAERPDQPLAGPLRALHALCTGTVNGRCQQVFFFNGQEMIDGIEAGIIDIVRQDGTTVQLRLPQYQMGDPGCCPSGPDSLHTVRLKDRAIEVQPPIPAQPNGPYAG